MTALDPGKLTSVNEHGDRLYLQPAEVKGFFRKYRNWTQTLLILFFMIVPWTKWDGHQTVLLNLPAREFNFFGVLFRAHDAPLVFFFIAGGALTLALVTAIWGRVWCGWACPQTVFIDGIFRRIELWTEGNYIQRRKMQTEAMTSKTFLKKLIKWFLFLVASSHIAHSFVAYFVGAPELLNITLGAPSNNWTLFIVVQFFTLLFLFDFGWFREQFCVIMCPYGRIQGILMDSKTRTIMYDEKRGEPRRGASISANKTNTVINSSLDKSQGDCVSCGKCVAACPTGIDIRNGLQLECIACTACADACDEIMEKVNKPKGLIGYKTLDGSPFTLAKPRNIGYFIAIIACAIGLVVSLSNHQSSHAALLRASGLPFSTVQDATGESKILNHFKLHVTNQSSEKQLYQIQLSPEAVAAGIELTVGQNPVELESKQFFEWHFFVKASPDKFKGLGQLKAAILIYNPENQKLFSDKKEFTLLGPK